MIKNILAKVYWILSSQFGLDPRRFMLSLRGVPVYLIDWIRFRKQFAGKMTIKPCLHDRYEEGGATRNEYFWQDLLVARWIFEAHPERHVDIGSRVDGFVAHVAAYRELEVFDVRPITTRIPGVIFKQADFMQHSELNSQGVEYCDSLSCLHAIEHFGLGRYGDPIDPQGYKRGIENMAKLLKPRGRFYLSAPVGEDRVDFNANRVFDPRIIIHCAESNGLRLHKLTVISSAGSLKNILPNENELKILARDRYNLGVFIFIKDELNGICTDSEI